MTICKLCVCALLQVIKANDDLTPEHHQFFLYQMLRGLKYIHTGTAEPGMLSAMSTAIYLPSCCPPVQAAWQIQ